jgi:gliding motility-associated-like protein
MKTRIGYLNNSSFPFSMAMMLCLVCFLFICNSIRSQENSIANGNITACGGFLVDSGLSAGDYGDNEDYTATICAATPETIVNLYWSVSDLGNGDYIEIFDGNSTSSALIGTYFGSDLQSQDITSTNAEGCLTVHFISDGTGVGNFGAEISCGLPCVRPFSVITSDQEPMPLYVCPGEEINFNASSTEFFNGSSLGSFSWNFDDGTSNTTAWPSVTHFFSQPGGYKVQLSVTDNNDCSNTNLNDYIVFVSTPPNFNLITNISDLCSGGEAFLGVTNLAQDSIFASDSLNNWISEPWIDLPDNFNSEGYHVEDVQTGCFDVFFTYNGFPAGEVIDEISDIVNTYINFEHSFIQDIVISVICPTGESMILHQQSGGGTDVGEAVIGTDGEAGIGYDYFWTPDATNGTWGENIATSPIPSGTYESEQPFTNLFGCPLNGTWQFEFCDMWGGDDGFLFNYGMTFDPNLYGEILNFTPTFGSGCDSTFWSGDGIVNLSSGCDYIDVVLSNPGTYDYTYTAINNFGCSYDTTISITVDVAPTVTAGADMTLDCNNPFIQLEGGFNDIPVASCAQDGGVFNYTYQNDDNFTWTFCPDPGAETHTAMTFTFISGQIEIFYDSFQVYDGANTSAALLLDWSTGDATGLSWTANNPTGCLTFHFEADGIFSAETGEYAPWTYEVGCEQLSPEFVWSWSPAQFLSTPQNFSSAINNLQQTQTFTLTGHPVGQPNCVSTDAVTVFVSSDMSVDVEEFYQECYGDSASLLPPTITGGTAPFETKWVSETGEEFFQESIQIPVGALKNYCAIVTDGCGARDTACTDVSSFPIIPASFQIDNQLGCDPHYVLMTSDFIEYQHIESMLWDFGDGTTANTMASANHEYSEGGSYYPTLEITDDNGCVVKDTLEMPVRVWPTPIAQFNVDEELILLPNTEFIFENNTLNGESYLWTFDAYGTSSAIDTAFTFPPATEGNYQVKLLAYNQYGCTDSTYLQVVVEEEIDLFVPNAFTPDGDGINDVWQLKGAGFQKDAYICAIFNRWGEKLFESSDPDDVWTGNYIGGGVFVPDGVYFYTITIRDTQNDINHLFEGHITIVR